MNIVNHCYYNRNGYSNYIKLLSYNVNVSNLNDNLINRYHKQYTTLSSLSSKRYITKASNHNHNQMNALSRNIRGIYIDFDDTVTVGSSVGIQMKTIEEKGITEESELRMRKSVVKEYSSDYQNLIDDILASKNKNEMATEKELNNIHNKCSNFLKKWHRIAVNKRISKGVSRKIFLNSALMMDIRAGCTEVIERCLRQDIPVSVISLNWSAQWIKSFLNLNCVNANKIRVYANELIYENEMSTGDITEAVVCCNDKARIFEQVDKLNKNGDKYSIFIGDSIFDLKSLLKADFGIIIGNNTTLFKTLEIYNIPTKNLSEAHQNEEYEKTLYKVKSWSEIEEFICNTNLKIKKPKLKNSVPRVLIIAGSDSGAGAGIQADIKTCLMNGSYATTAITAITSQNTKGIHSIYNIPSHELKNQITTILNDIGTDVMKISMLPDVESIKVILNCIKEFKVNEIILDPVIMTSTDHELVHPEIVEEMKEHLFNKITLLTPNILEAEKILSIKITSLADMEEAILQLHKLGIKNVLLKGGHFIDTIKNEITDIFYDGTEMTHFTHKRIKTQNSHGTGCTLASAIASGLAQGKDYKTAINDARLYLYTCLESSINFNIGEGISKPMNHNIKLNLKKKDKIFDLKLYVITDEILNKKYKRNLIDSVLAAVKGGATMVQIRDKDKNTKEFMNDVMACKEITKEYNVPLIVNDRIDIALATDADGVHIGEDDMEIDKVRELLGEDKIIGVTTRTIERAKEAKIKGADYLGVGSIYKSFSKNSKIIGLKGLNEISYNVKLPIVAIGGITRNDINEVMKNGANGIALISAIFDTEDPKQTTEEIRSVLDTIL